MPAVRDRKHLCPPGEEEFRSKVLSCEAPLLGPAPLIPFYIVKPVACFFLFSRYFRRHRGCSSSPVALPCKTTIDMRRFR